MLAKFLVAKYAPDVKRMEPRNIGVIVWANGYTASRFLGDSRGESTMRIPKRIGVVDRRNYNDWITSWRRELSKSCLELSRGRMVSRNSDVFLECFRELADGNYILVNGGSVGCRGSGLSEIEELADYLFDEMVGSGSLSF